MKKYSYKDSGIEWLGEIPKHWKTTKIKKAFIVQPSNVNKKSKEDEDEVSLCNYVDVYYNETITNDLKFMTATASENEIKKFQLQVNDVIITKDSEDPFDIAVPALVKQIQEKLLCGYHLSMIRTINNKITGSFLFWSLNNEFIASQLFREATGVTRWAIALRHVKDSTITYPPIPEQKAIANYLDKATQKIDRIIEIKMEQMEKLEESFINSLTEWLTIGEGKSKVQKTSCYWIPKIKEGWKIQPLKRLLSSKLKYGANEPAENEDKDEPRYIRITDFGSDGKLRNNTYKSLPLIKALPYMLSEGDVLFARSGATVGKTFIFKDYDGKACFAGYLIKAECDRTKLLPEYLYYFTKTKSYKEWKNLIFTQATIQNIGADKYQYLPIPIPKINEQQLLIWKIKLLDQKISKLMKNIKSQIKTLQDYRKSLIHECVTGKKQVADIYISSSEDAAYVE